MHDTPRANPCRSRIRALFAALAILAFAPTSLAQLANPSFETAGAATAFDAWGQLGNVAVATDLVADGARSAKVWGPFASTWAVSGVHQDVPASPGGFLAATVHAGHPASDPLTGAARAIMNVEWRDAAGALISYRSFDLLDASDPTGIMRARTFAAGPAPAGTATARLLLGVLQSPANEPGSARFDLASVTDDPDAVHDALQWNDFGNRAIEFAGYTWRCKEGESLGPGPNPFADGPDNVEVDADGRLRLRVTSRDGGWHCAEIALVDALGHGEYRFVTRGRVDLLDPSLVLGMFLWEYQESYDGWDEINVANEFDVELSRWGNPQSGFNAQFVAQPWHNPGNLSRYLLTLDSPDALVTHAFLWRDGQVVCRAWMGEAPEPTAETLLHHFDYTGEDVPRDEAPRVHVNLWLMYGNPPTDGQEHEIVLEGFVFLPPPPCPGDLDGDGDTDVFDFARFVSTFAQPVPPLTGGDLTGNGTVDIFDFAVLAGDFACGRSR